jgi:hypothetical protein
MADWRRLTKDLILIDGKIDDRETGLVRGLVFAGGQVDDAELDFLLEVKQGAMGVAPSFNQLVLDAVKQHMLGDGTITPMKAEWLRRWVLADGQVNPPEKKLLQELKAGAKKSCPEFDNLYQKAMAG